MLWYLPPIPRFVRLFRNAKHAKNLAWHADERIKDGKLRHPADTLAWKRIDLKWTSFGDDLNRIGHKSDRFILASQAKQVFYVNDPSDSQWSVVLQTQTRDWKIQDSELEDIPLEGELVTFNPR